MKTNGNENADELLRNLEEMMNTQPAFKTTKTVEVPCLIGDTVWTNFSFAGDYLRKKDAPYPLEVVFIGLNGGDGHIHVRYKNGRMWLVKFSQLSGVGALVFLTKEEALRSKEKWGAGELR